jgi:hypothetical protein
MANNQCIAEFGEKVGENLCGEIPVDNDYCQYHAAMLSDVDKEIEIDMLLAALEYNLKLCREHGTYVPIETLALSIHNALLKDDTEFLIKHLSALVAKGKRERE